MRIESKLCHISENKVIVQVIGWVNDKSVGSALAEGSTVEIAEDQAILRLNKRFNSISNNEVINKELTSTKEKNDEKADLIKTDKNEDNNSDQEPNDWSNELTAIDSEILKLKWSRDDENKFLENNFGYNNRSKITKYNEIVDYLNKLKKLNKLNTPQSDSINMISIINESDQILKELSWDHQKGREYLLKEFNVSSRKELDETQLMSFVSKLKSIRNQFISQ